jgi:hypothetical protein
VNETIATKVVVFWTMETDKGAEDKGKHGDGTCKGLAKRHPVNAQIKRDSYQ